MSFIFKKSSIVGEYRLLGHTGQHKDILQLEETLRLVQFDIIETKITYSKESDKKVYFFMRIYDNDFYYKTRDAQAELEKLKMLYP